MERLTQKTPDGYRAEDLTAALDRLGRFEDFYESVLTGQESLSAELAALRDGGKQKSYEFRERMGKKLTNTEILLRLDSIIDPAEVAAVTLFGQTVSLD